VLATGVMTMGGADDVMTTGGADGVMTMGFGSVL